MTGSAANQAWETLTDDELRTKAESAWERWNISPHDKRRYDDMRTAFIAGYMRPIAGPKIGYQPSSRDNLAEVIYQTINLRRGEPSQASGTNNKRWQEAFEITDAILASRLATAARRVPTVEEIETTLRKMVAEYALDQESIHANWRCQYPDQYGPCRCVDEFVVEYTAVLSGLYGEGNGA